jgi:hypothetical protein
MLISILHNIYYSLFRLIMNKRINSMLIDYHIFVNYKAETQTRQNVNNESRSKYHNLITPQQSL